jgi:hypothetical protein
VDRFACLVDGYFHGRREVPVRAGQHCVIPGAGDMVCGAVSAMIVVTAARRGVPRATVLRMIANVAIDSTLGAIPLFGDFFDAYFKANVRNAKLYREAAAGHTNQKKDAAFVALVAVALLVLLSVPIAIAVWVIAALIRL